MSARPEKVSVMRNLVVAVAGPRLWQDTRQSWLARAARKAGISYRQCKALFYGEITDPYHKAARKMRDAAEGKAKELADQYQTIAGVLSVVDAEFHRDTVAALLDVARTLRGSGSSEGTKK